MTELTFSFWKLPPRYGPPLNPLQEPWAWVVHTTDGSIIARGKGTMGEVTAAYRKYVTGAARGTEAGEAVGDGATP